MIWVALVGMLFGINGECFAKSKHHKFRSRPESSLSKINKRVYKNFSKTVTHFIASGEIKQDQKEYLWECEPNFSFTELIFSWNALRPDKGKFIFWVNVKHKDWAGWQRLAEWGVYTQRTFVNKLNRYVHTKHVRVEIQKGFKGRAFKVKVVANGGAILEKLSALFACMSNPKDFSIKLPLLSNIPTVVVKGVPRQSQMVLDHPRFKDLCSPTSTSMLVNYFTKKYYKHTQNLPMNEYVLDFADKVHDNGPLSIYGNWLLNVAQAYDSSKGEVFYRVERLNSFYDLYNYLVKKIPVAVSVRRLRGGATPYSNGHFIVVVGWSRERRSVLCIDPAFGTTSRTLKAYNLKNFLRAWGRSENLSYIPIPKEEIS
jgi:hypothetical protein